jgi:hypothetical protein
MYDMPPPKLGENTSYWQLPRHVKPAGALAAACIVNKTFPDVYGFLEEKFWEIVRNEEMDMERVSILIRCSCLRNSIVEKILLTLFSTTEPCQEDSQICTLPVAYHWLELCVRVRGLDR